MTSAELDMSKAEAFVERLFEAAGQTMETFAIFIGDRLGLYRVLADKGPMRAGDIAGESRIDERYATEWLEYQVVTGVLEVDDPTADSGARKYSLPNEHAIALTDPDSPLSIVPMSRFVAALGPALPRVLEAFRSGGGVPWADFGSDVIEAQGDFNRPWLRADLAGSYLPFVPDLHEKLSNGACVVDIACGVAWASFAIAKGYPQTSVVGLDPDTDSIEMSKTIAVSEGVADRVSFYAHDCVDPLPGGPFDFAIMVESLHDVARPVEILSRVRESLAEGGTMIVADEKTGESFAEPGPSDAIFYGFSVLCCLPAGMSEDPTAKTGTVMRASTLERYAREAGFSRVEVLSQIDHPLLRFYRLSP